EHASGFMGVASDFVSNDAVFDILKESLLGNVLIVSKIEDANRFAKQLHHSYKIVTLDGDVMHRGGTMSGGKTKNNQQSMLTLKG
ncbi:hypothetical protein PT160_08785, partial [Erysipelothrix rhusiopathiae]|nr:hypothetical protein [Erysipelothrix rhusiopathiae]